MVPDPYIWYLNIKITLASAEGGIIFYEEGRGGSICDKQSPNKDNQDKHKRTYVNEYNSVYTRGRHSHFSNYLNKK